MCKVIVHRIFSFRSSVLVFSFLFISVLLEPQSVRAEIYKGSARLNELVFKIRDPQTKADPFRKALAQIGEFLGAEVLQVLTSPHTTTSVQVTTLTGAKATHELLTDSPVLVTILRAGMPLLNGVQEIFPEAEVGFFGMARVEESADSQSSAEKKKIEVEASYIALPNVKNKTVILIDTMLASGTSFIDAIQIIRKREPKEIIVVCAIASLEGKVKVSEFAKVFAAAVDPELNSQSYIIPGLGDAGDRAYGKKVNNSK